jgi:hypothetical protein
MKILMLSIIIFSSVIVYSQDTISINEKAITLVQNRFFDKKDPREGVWIYTHYYAFKNTKRPLNGYYKVTIDKNNYYIIHFELGTKTTGNRDKVVKYYKNKKLSKIDIYFEGYYSSSSTYWTINFFDCKSKKAIIYRKNYWSESIEDTLYAQQSYDEEYINWVYIFDGREGNNYISKKLCDCP